MSTYLCPNCSREFEEAWTAQRRILCSHCQHSFTLRELRKAAALHALPPGSVLAGYQIQSLVGAGGMSQVFRATRQGDETEVALKIMRLKGRDAAEIQQFVGEIRNTGQLEHPGIVRLLDAGADADTVYYVMEYIKGEPLDSRLRRRQGPLPEIEALHLVRQVAVALQYAWDEKRVAHRDVKPGNIMVDRQNRVKLLDLGISRQMREEIKDDDEVIGLAIGTPYYMSPEQARGKSDVDFRSDMYSLGATLYHLVTGRVPFFSEEIALIMRQHIASPCPRPSFFREDLSSGCECLILTLMEKSRASRFPSWQAVVDEIDIVLGMREAAEKAQAPSTTLGNLIDDETDDLLAGVSVEARKTRMLTRQEREGLASPIVPLAVVPAPTPGAATKRVRSLPAEPDDTHVLPPVGDAVRGHRSLVMVIAVLSVVSLVLLIALLAIMF